MEPSRELATTDFSDYQEITIPDAPTFSQKYKNSCELAAELLANGNSIRGVAATIGLHWDTVEYWLKNFPHFRSLVDLKKKERRELLLGKIDKHTDKNWFAAAWLLERNKAFEGEFAQPKAQAQANIVAQINVSLSTPPAGQGETTITLSTLPSESEEK